MIEHYFTSPDQLYLICIGYNNQSGGFFATIIDNNPSEGEKGEETIFDSICSIKSLDELKSFVQEFAVIPKNLVQELEQDFLEPQKSENCF